MDTNKQAPYIEFGNRLFKLRSEAAMTRKQLGDICGVAPSTIVNYERGIRIPFADTAVKMAQAFNLTVEELLDMENPNVELAKAEALDSMRKINGSLGAKRLERALNTVGNVLAGGDLDEELTQEYIFEMQKLAFQATQKLREKHTNKKYKDTVEAKAEETREQIEVLNDAIRALHYDD